MKAIALALMLLLLPALLRAQDGLSQAQSEALAAAVARTAEVPALDDLLRACPADLYARHAGLPALLQGLSGTLDEGACEADIDACARLCLTRNNGGACLDLAILIEVEGLPDQRLAARKLHARACAMGQAAGCTNRGGGIRNVPLEGDARSLAATPAQDECLFRTFAATCEAGDSWGCTMSAQTHAYGEGVAQDDAMALDLYERACVLAEDPTFDACIYARAGIAEIRGE